MTITKFVEKAEVVSSWTPDDDLANAPQIALDYPCYCEDVTHQPNVMPDPNAVICLIKVRDSAVLDQMEADGIAVIHRKEIVEDLI